MSLGRYSCQSWGNSDNRGVYTTSFKEHVYGLLEMGYNRLAPKRHKHSDETAITGELARAIDEVLDDTTAPSWVRFYSVYDDPAVNQRERYGKRRRRVDIKFTATICCPRPKFHFEAKRLHDSGSAAEYLGADGLGCFITGAYARDADEAGMLGYVQSNDEETWAMELCAILNNSNCYCVCKDGRWNPCVITSQLKHTYTTRHSRAKRLGPIRISHVLLRFF